MRFRGFLSTLMILSALAVPTATSSAQGPASPTAFDGKYVGTATLTHEHRDYEFCYTIRSMRMTITGGQVVMHDNGGRATYRGSVNAAGEVSATTLDHLVIVSGTIHDKAFTGQCQYKHYCHWSVQMTPAPAQTMPFDGDYRGVSREVSDSEINEHRCVPRALTPPLGLTITNGVVGIPGEWWQGTVSPQGAVVIGNPKFSRVDGQIDRQGTIRGQYSGELPSDLAQIDGGGTNCTIKFVWQRE